MNSTDPVFPHQDPGLQPERTVMSWGRTTLALCVAAMVFARWLPHYGIGMLVLISLCLLAAGGIYFTQRKRYKESSHGIVRERIHADVVAVFAMSAIVIGLGVVGLLVIITG
ncbi:hypothetical protein CQ018_18250 [Arthrobacter sp. MYb227]|uniref:DUF202 domain-containing protein n=1 Tax=Arthrobacter sp. MYb227 TaxID=1848601 RepID=UPI000CFD93F8|nr:DUF202 domain-containing protein [Arthrobacter sp. MYb227]PQZ86979.1 hypothetical protein CQ018_18250 [Arthrobacter sp. MYb227]